MDTHAELEEFTQLFRFYNVSTIAELVWAQEKHIVRLQAQMQKPTYNQMVAQPLRQG